jgi:two-component system KDP operon response regulator KdpE
MKVLIIEDDPQTVEAVSLVFKLRWTEAELLSTPRGMDAAPLVEKESPDVVILDLGLPDIDGTEALKEIRAFSDVPVLILTARDDATSQVKGLELGADEYITKPFDPSIMLARLKKLLQPHQSISAENMSDFARGGLIIDFSTRDISFNSHPVKLTSTEYRLLTLLARNTGNILPRENVLQKIWGNNWDTNALKTSISRLRSKLVASGADHGIITFERGAGYKLNLPG